MKVGDKPIFEHKVQAEFSGDDTFDLLKSVNIRTKKLNEKYKLTNSQAIVFQVHPPFVSDGATIPSFARWLIPRKADWILLAGVAHDWIWGEGFINAYVLDISTGVITREIGNIDVTLKEGNEIMLEKMNSYYAPFFKMYIVFFTLEVVRLIKEL